jgi:hypothetical protein
MTEIIIKYLKPQIIKISTTFLLTNFMIEITCDLYHLSLKFDAFQVIKKKPIQM